MPLCFRAAALAAIVLAAPAGAAEIKVLTTGAYKPVIAAMASEFERRTGRTLRLDNDTAGGLLRRVRDGEVFDLLVLPSAPMQSLVTAGTIAAGPVPLARVAIGVAVRRGAPLPDIGSVAAFRSTLLAARTVAVIDPAAGGSSGIYLAKLFERMGIAEPMRAKAVLVPGGLVAQRVVDGQAELAIHQISEILAVPAAQLVGPLPAEIQNYTTYVGGVSASAQDGAAARSLLELLAGPAARSLLGDKGMEAPGAGAR